MKLRTERDSDVKPSVKRSPELEAFKQASDAAFEVASKDARRIARESNTPIIVVRDGQIVELWADDDFTQPRRVIGPATPDHGA